MEEDPLRALVQELSEAEKQSLDEEGPIQDRLHEAIKALCDYADVVNQWETTD